MCPATGKQSYLWKISQVSKESELQNTSRPESKTNHKGYCMNASGVQQTQLQTRKELKKDRPARCINR